MVVGHIRRTLMSTAMGLVLCTGAGPVFAESLADALVMAYRTSPLLDSSRAALRGLDESVPQAKANLRPQVDASISGSTQPSLNSIDSLSDRINTAEAALNASLLIFDSGSTKAAVEAARNRIAAGRADLKDIEQLVLFNAVVAYVDVRQAEEFVRLAQNDVQRLDETLRATQNRFDVGEVTRTDVSQSVARLADSRAQLSASEGLLDQAEEAYRAAVGKYPQNLEGLPRLPEIPRTLDESTAVGLRRNPQIVAARYSERAAVYDFDRARSAKGPTLSAGAAIGIGRNNNRFGGQYDTDSFGRLNVIGSLPLYTGGRNDSLIRQAQAILDQRRFEVQDVARSVSQDVANAWSELDVARASIIARREQAEASLIAAEGVAEEARLGARSTLDVLNADQERLEADAEVVRSIRNEYVATYGLMQAMGLLTAEHLKLGVETYDPDMNYMNVQHAPSGGYDTSVVDRIRSRWER